MPYNISDFMTEKNYYVLFSDSKKSEKVSREEFLDVRFLARSYNAILSVVPHRFGTTLSVAFSRFFFNSQLIFRAL